MFLVPAILPTHAWAQQVDDSGTIFLDRIDVTARKVEEPVQRIPFGISVFQSEDIERQRIRDARSFGRSVPGFNFVDTGLRGSNFPNIRGVGSFFPQSADDTSVPVFIDGVPVPVRAQDREFFDIERIEVLKGPQNTIYGRNAQAGAINVTTADPSPDRFFEIGGELGNFGSGRVTALANGPISKSLAGRIAAQFDTRDGYIPEFNFGGEVGEQELVNANGKLVWSPDDLTKATLALRYGNYDEQPAGGGWLEDPNFPRLFLDTLPSYEVETVGGGLTIQRDFDRATLTSVTGVQYYTLDFLSDDTDGFIFNALTGLPPAVFNVPGADFRTIRDEDIQFSQEIRLNGELANGTQWVAGINAFRSELEFDFTFNNTGFIFGDFHNEFTSTSFAAFGEVTVPVSDRLRAIAGLRFTHEMRDFDGMFVDRSGGTLGFNSQESEDESFNLATGRVALTFDFLPDLTGFASISRGAKAGGFQLADTDAARGLPNSRFDPAFTLAYEAGLRGSLFGGRINLSGSAFFNNTEDEHVQVFQPLTFQSVIENIDTQTYGLELEGAFRPIESLTFSGGLALLETEITGSDDPSVPTGNRVPFAPRVAANLAVQVEQPLSLLGHSGRAFGRAEYQYVGSRTVDPQNTFDIDSFNVVNLRAGWDSERVSVYGFVDNLFDETYAETAFLFGTNPAGQRVSVGIAGQPRRLGVGARLRF
ncbi:MAG: TonB-dependent receptor [Pseudomonadota bacterium]